MIRRAAEKITRGRAISKSTVRQAWPWAARWRRAGEGDAHRRDHLTADRASRLPPSLSRQRSRPSSSTSTGRPGCPHRCKPAFPEQVFHREPPQQLRSRFDTGELADGSATLAHDVIFCVRDGITCATDSARRSSAPRPIPGSENLARWQIPRRHGDMERPKRDGPDQSRGQKSAAGATARGRRRHRFLVGLCQTSGVHGKHARRWLRQTVVHR